jgi:BlaI family transcriptional regulator, penicillinase repressor
MEIKPTESELEILQIIWEKDQCSVRDVHDVLEKTKDAGYTTTLKLMQIMHDKGLVERDTSAKTHLYKAVITREQAQNTAVNKILATVFNGSSSQLIMQVLSNQQSSKEELDMIKDYLNQLEQKK